MTDDEIIKIIEQQATAAATRQRQLRKIIIASFTFVAVITIIFGAVIFDQSQTITELSQTINRRSPILDYLQCHDNLQDTRNKEQTYYIFTLIDGGENPSPEALLKQGEARLNYEEAELNLEELKGCNDFPATGE